MFILKESNLRKKKGMAGVKNMKNGVICRSNMQYVFLL